MFIHSRAAQVRVIAAGLAILIGGLAVLINPFSHAQTYASDPVPHGLIFLLVLLMLGICAYLWWIAPTLPQPPLPDPAKWTGPNRIPVSTRLINVVASAALLGYGTYGLYIDDIFIPAKGRGGAHLSGVSAWLMYAAFLCAIASLLAVVADHYDRRNNELNYAHFTVASQWVGWGFFILAFLWQWVAR
jgi:hypothetical protein